MEAAIVSLAFILIHQFFNGQKYFALAWYAIDKMKSPTVKLYVEAGDTTVIQRKDIISFDRWPFDPQ